MKRAKHPKSRTESSRSAKPCRKDRPFPLGSPTTTPYSPRDPTVPSLYYGTSVPRRSLGPSIRASTTWACYNIGACGACTNLDGSTVASSIGVSRLLTTTWQRSLHCVVRLISERAWRGRVSNPGSSPGPACTVTAQPRSQSSHSQLRAMLILSPVLLNVL